MQVDTYDFNSIGWNMKKKEILDNADADIIFIFGDTDAIIQPDLYNSMQNIYPNAHIVGASTAGNILGAEISSASVVATAISFQSSHVKLSIADFNIDDNIASISKSLIEKLPADGLKHIFIISEGLDINGSELVAGINNQTPAVSVTGGMAGDGGRFQETWIIADAPAVRHRIVAIGFYGENLHISSGCYSGWSEFGTDRIITKSKENIVYEIDHEPALDLYKRYLGEYAKELPSSGLRFPLSIKENQNDPEIIRTLLSVDENEKSITFAANVPQGYIARLMKPEIDILIDAASKVAKGIPRANEKSALGLVVSCIGRKIILDQLVEEELEAIENILGINVHLTGFYSYGEIAPFLENKLNCQLHNQTMTLTAIYED